MSCKQCEGPMDKKRPGQFYCSNACQMQHQHQTKVIPKILSGECKNPRILKAHIVENDGHRCSCCKNTEWMDEPIPLELDHIDGNADNNLPENLRVLCPNCHAQTPTYKSKNKGNGRHFRRQRYAEGKSF